MKLAIEASQWSNCGKRKVGAVLVRDRSVLSIAYNGSLPGAYNCTKEICGDPLGSRYIEEGMSVCNFRASHAECNAIALAAKNGVSTDNASLYCTLKPCASCVKLICMAGIKEVYYLDEYINGSENYQAYLTMLYEETKIKFIKMG